MGAFGTGILENDTTVNHLIYIDTLRTMKLGNNKIQQIMLHNYLKEEDRVLEYDIDRYTEFWTAIAFAEWFYDKPSEEVIKKIEKIIKSNNSFDSWGESNERMSSIKEFYQTLQTSRINIEKRNWKIWFWENSFEITKNEFSDVLKREYELLTRLGIKNRIEILQKKYEGLTEDFEEPIFWATIAVMIDERNEMADVIKEKLEDIRNNSNSMNVIKVAYNEHHRTVIMDSIINIELP